MIFGLDDAFGARDADFCKILAQTRERTFMQRIRSGNMSRMATTRRGPSR